MYSRFSGIKAEDLVGVTITLGDIQDMLIDMFSDKTILIGHSLESDLIALKVGRLIVFLITRNQ